MSPKTNLTVKFSLFLVVFTLILLTTILSYLYLSDRNAIKKIATRDVEFYIQLFSENLQTSVTNSVHELHGLQPQLNGNQIKPDKFPQQVLEADNPIERFIIGYSPKYNEMIFFNPSWYKILKTSPVKVFGGDTKILYEWIAPSKSEFFLFEKDTDQVKIWGPDIESGERLIYVSIAGNLEEKIFMAATISLDFLIEHTLNNFDFPDDIDVTITDSSGIILYAKQKEYINQYIQRTHPDIGKSINLQPFSDGGDNNRNRKLVWRWHELQIPKINIILSKNISPEIQHLNATFLRMVLYAGIILLFVLVVVRILVQKMTGTFSQITTIADKVANGDFSKKIAIHRQDELGTLINVFNEMVDKINASYRSLNQVNIELQEKIIELTKTRAELSQKQRLALIGETISKISHEIQNKIGGVSIWVQNLEMQLKDDLSAQIYIEEMKNALNSFMAMLANFKRFYREPQLTKTNFSVIKMIENVEHHFYEEIKERKIQVIRCIQNDDIFIHADEDQIEEAFINIFVNALYYSPPEGKIEIRVEQTDLDIILSICDEGPGISNEISTKLLQPFFTTKSSGSGLGLAIVDNIIRAHQGSFSFFNRDKKGACFTIKLPYLNVKRSSEDELRRKQNLQI